MMRAKPHRNQFLHAATEQLGAREAEHSLGLRIHQDDLTGRVDNHHRIGRGFQQVTQLLFGALALGDVADSAGDHGSFSRLQRAQADLDWKFGSILTQSEEFQPGTHGARLWIGEIILPVLWVASPKPLRHQLVDRAADQLLA